jgi:hypothetical protein
MYFAIGKQLASLSEIDRSTCLLKADKLRLVAGLPWAWSLYETRQVDNATIWSGICDDVI